MKVGIDAHRLLSEPHSSGATYLAAFLKGCVLIPEAKRASLILYVPKNPDSSHWLFSLSKQIQISLRCPSLHCQPSKTYRHQLYWNQVVLPSLALKDELDVFFCPFHLTPLLLRRTPIVTTVHDLCFLSHPKCYSPLGRIVHAWEIWTARTRARRLIAVSDFTLEQWAKYFPQSSAKVIRIHTGLEIPPDTSNAGIQKRFPSFLWIGRNDLRKNPEIVFKAFRLYLELHKNASERLWALVPAHEVRFFEELAQRHGVHRRVDVLSSLSEEEKWFRLRSASALLLPSTCEGFALPIFEAMQAGCIPIVPPFGPWEEFLPRGFPRLGHLTARSIADLLAWVHLLDESQRRELSSALRERAATLNCVQMATHMLCLFEKVVAEYKKLRKARWIGVNRE